MPYYTDTITSFSLLQSVIESRCVDNGWTLADGILSKDSCFFKLDSSLSSLSLQGGLSKTGSTLNTAGGQVCIQSQTDNTMTFPITYFLFIFNNPSEVYLFIKYNTSYYQHLNFGKSDLLGIGLGSWYNASCSSYSTDSRNSILVQPAQDDVAVRVSGDSSERNLSCGLFCGIGYNSSYVRPTSYLYTNLDSKGWCYFYNNLNIGSSLVSGLLTASPNLFNQASILLPIKGVVSRSSGGLTICCNLKNARLLRLDNHQSEDVITFGSDQWKVFPWYRRNVNERNGGVNISHSGTFGFAIRYEV